MPGPTCILHPHRVLPIWSLIIFLEYKIILNKGINLLLIKTGRCVWIKLRMIALLLGCGCCPAEQFLQVHRRSRPARSQPDTGTETCQPLPETGASGSGHDDTHQPAQHQSASRLDRDLFESLVHRRPHGPIGRRRRMLLLLRFSLRGGFHTARLLLLTAAADRGNLLKKRSMR